LFRHDEGRAVCALEQLIGRVAVDKALGFGVQIQGGAEYQGGLVKVNPVGTKVVLHSPQAFGQVMVTFGGVGNGFRLRELSEAMGNVGGMHQGGRSMPDRDVGVEVGDLAAVNGFD